MKITNEYVHDKINNKNVNRYSTNPLMRDELFNEGSRGFVNINNKKEINDISEEKAEELKHKLKNRFRVICIIAIPISISLFVSNVKGFISCYEITKKYNEYVQGVADTQEESDRLMKMGQLIASSEEYKLIALRNKYALVKEGEEVVRLPDITVEEQRKKKEEKQKKKENAERKIKENGE